MTKKQKLHHIDHIMLHLKDIIEETIDRDADPETYVNEVSALDMVKDALEQYEELMNKGE